DVHGVGEGHGEARRQQAQQRRAAAGRAQEGAHFRQQRRRSGPLLHGGLAHRGKAPEKGGGGEGADDRGRHGIGGSPAGRDQALRQRRHQPGHRDAAGEGALHAQPRQGGADRAVARHRRRQRGVGDGEGVVQRAHQQLARQGVTDQQRQRQARRREAQHEGQRQRQRAKQQVRSIPAPAGARAVGGQAQKGIGQAVPD